MLIDYIVISSDDNPLYKDFYKPVSLKWDKLGYKVFYINITDNESEIIENEYGLIKNIKALSNINSGFQSQVVRLFAASLLPDKNLLMSDIDMLPLNGNYFSEKAKDINDDEILIYSGQPYGDMPYHPMCYVLGKGKILKEALNIEDDYNTFISNLASYSNLDWNSDEKYLYEKLQNFSKKIILKDRNFSRRIDRSNWNYSLEKLNNGYYIDSHLLRPYNQYKNEIDKLI